MDNHPIKILLVEDNPGDVLLLEETLSDIAHFRLELSHAERLSQALHRLEAETFDVILLDLLLPDSEGLETFLQIYDRAPLTPIVVLTGMADETLALRAMQAGAQDYLVKGRTSSSDLLMRSIRYAIERKRNEAALYQREQEFRTLTENAPDIIARFDRNLRHLYVNPAVEAVTGLSVRDFLGKTNRELGMPEALVKQWEEALEQVFETGEQVSIQFEFPTSSGLKYYQSRCVPEFALNGSVESVLAITRDLTEQKQLESQLLRAQRMESLGTLASGIAHDMNNILTPILAIAPLLPLSLPPLNEQSRQLLNILEENAKRGADLVKQILTFSRGLEGERAPIQVKHLLGELEQVMHSTFPKSITIVCNIATEDLWLVSADATQLHQVFMNCCVNARDAMPQGGTLTISAENRAIDEIYARMNLNAKVGPYVVITFTDTGTGISAEHIDRIFEPFFTTKAWGEGTGLGLSTAMGIIKNYGGFISVNSEVDKGTQLQVFLPAIEGIETPVPEKQNRSLGRGELILVVDDEENIRETLKITLEIQNYRVLTANDGIEAIAAYAQHRNDIEVVLIDMMMPLMGGAEAIRALQQFNPQVKIIACSGVAVSDSFLKTTGVKAFLAKPFTASDLLNALHGAIAAE
ncbi:response regulator [Altericista sp. CCNU0014]|uniref:hybrid sensor histidine kinase/response regulator n=1 Tax=Altericista sp. CCNU0014 TaxID=3082949 RepID=UPI00384C98AE